MNVAGLHTGAAIPQSALPRHSTQVPLEARQRGAVAGQSELPAHSTQVCVVALQTFAVAGQSLAVLHPTQTPAAVSQMVAPRPVHWASVVHAAWQVCVPGKHAGVVPVPQSVFDSHATQLPCRQNRAAAGHWESVVQSTQPSVTSHCLVAGHALVPLGPQSALPPPGPASPAKPRSPLPLDVPPPHAQIAIATANPETLCRTAGIVYAMVGASY
jgi:hypothetical protein